MNLGKKNLSTWLFVIGTIAFFAIAFVIAMFMHGLGALVTVNWSGIHLLDVLNFCLLFAVLGGYYGAIVALDSESGIADTDRPIIRAMLCGLLAAIAVLLVQAWPPQTFNMVGAVIGFFVGAILGWIGWRWAKYVDF